MTLIEVKPTAQRERQSRTRVAHNQGELSESEIIFIEAYCTNGFDVRAASREVGFHNPRSGYHLLTRPLVVKAIYERMHFEKMAAPEVVNRVALLARADLKDFLRVEEWEEKVEREDGDDPLAPQKTVTRKRVVVDLMQALENDATYPLKWIEFYRTGEVRKIALEDKLEALKLVGSVFGLFGTGQRPGDDGRAWFDKARDMGYDPKMVLEEVIKIAGEWKMDLPKSLIEGQFSQMDDADARENET